MEKTEQVGRWNIYEARYFRGQSKNKKWGKTAVFFHSLHSSGSNFYYYYRNTLELICRNYKFIYKDFEWNLGFGIVRIR